VLADQFSGRNTRRILWLRHAAVLSVANATL
jgi:hypothetical protein